MQQLAGAVLSVVLFLFYHVKEARAVEFDLGEAIKINSSGDGVASQYQTVSDLVNRVLPNVYIAAGVILLFGLATVGYKYVLSTGDPEKVKETGRHFSYLIVAMLIIFASYWLVKIMGIFTGITLL